MHTRHWIIIIALIIVSGCSSDKETGDRLLVEDPQNVEADLSDDTNGQNNRNPDPEEARIIHCDGISIPLEYTSEGVRLTFHDRTLSLPKTVSASGERYENGDVVFHAKADSVYLEVRGMKYENCRMAKK